MPEATEEKLSKLSTDFRLARGSSVPLIMIETADPASSLRQIRKVSLKAPIVGWDNLEGFTAKNEEAISVLIEVLGPQEDPNGEPTNNWKITKPDEALEKATKFRGKTQVGSEKIGGTIFVMMQGHRFIDPMLYGETHSVIQGIWNLRDLYKTNMRTLVIPCPQAELPSELQHDFIVLDDPLPSKAELGESLSKIYQQAYRKAITKETLQVSTEATLGLSAFQAEQVFSTSLRKEGVDVPRLWERKRKTVEMRAGNKIWRGPENFSQVIGVPIIKGFLSLIMENPDNPPTLIILWDELEKALSGAQSGSNDSASQEIHGLLLSWMADNHIPALRMIGHAGCSKSHIAKAVAGQYNRPCIVQNFSEMKNKWVGESTKRFVESMKMVLAIGWPLVMATCNNESVLSPEFRDRFNMGTWMFDLPNPEQRAGAWKQHCSFYGVSDKRTFSDEGWSYRNIHDCASLSKITRQPLDVAKNYIVSISKSNPKGVQALREFADGKYLSVEYDGTYVNPNKKTTPIQNMDVDNKRFIDLSNSGEA